MAAIYVDYDDVEEIVRDIHAINNALKNIVLTRIGSVPGKPWFGSNIYLIPFSQIDHITVERAKRYIKEAIIRCEDRVTINTIRIDEVPEYNRIVANITYVFNVNGIISENTVSINLV